MYTEHSGTQEYPFYATFYHLVLDDSLPLDKQVEKKIVSFETVCDVDDQNTGLNNNVITLYFPFDPSNGALSIILGETMEVETYGLTQRGRVLGVFPSQLGGVKVMCTRI
jgi:hypothetical protein